MLLYVYGDSFPDQTIVLHAEPSHSVARVKAQLLHLVRPLGLPFLTFDLTLRGQAMSEGLLLSDYHIFGQTDLGLVTYAAELARDAEGAELLSAEIAELALLTRLSLAVKTCAAALVVLAMASFFSDWGWEMSWNFLIAVTLLAATWRARTAGLRVFLALTPLAVVANLYVQFDYWLSPSGRCEWPDGRIKWYCIPLTNACLVLMLPLQALGFAATLRFLRNLRFYPGRMFEDRLRSARTLQAMLLAARSPDPEARRVAAKALAKHAAESGANARRLVEERVLTVLRDLVRTGDDNIKVRAQVGGCLVFVCVFVFVFVFVCVFFRMLISTVFLFSFFFFFVPPLPSTMWPARSTDLRVKTRRTRVLSKTATSRTCWSSPSTSLTPCAAKLQAPCSDLRW
jgi:hypothetical protein